MTAAHYGPDDIPDPGRESTPPPPADDVVPLHIQKAIEAEIEELKSQGKLARIEPRCKICRDKTLREIVNRMLRSGMSRPAIMDCLGPLNDLCESEKDKINYQNLYVHQKRHYNVSEPAQAVWDAIVDKHATENETSIEGAIEAQVNVFSFYETMMMKGYENLRREETQVPYQDGAKAARALYELTRKDAGAFQVADAIARMNRIVAVMQEVVPAKYHDAILARVDGREVEAIEGEVVDEVADRFDDLPGDDEDDD
jgi:hypothetical protein